MLKQGSVSDLLSGRVSRQMGYVVITMRRYPRFVRRELRDEYVSKMSPLAALHEDWLAAKRRHNDHDGAFRRSHFEERFNINSEGLRELARFCELSRKCDVYFICQCHENHRCHRELLLLLASSLFRAKTDPVRNDYPLFQKRIGEFKARVGKIK